MGQSVTVVTKPSSNPEVLRFEINRSLTGMGHERYRSVDDIILDRPVDVLARRLLAEGGVAGVHVNSSMITVELAGGSSGQGLEEVIRNLFRFYPDAEDDAADAAAEQADVTEAVDAAPEAVDAAPEAMAEPSSEVPEDAGDAPAPDSADPAPSEDTTA